MRYYSSTVRCATCGKDLARAEAVPEDQLFAAADAASARAFCAGHVKNSNLTFDWKEVSAPAQAMPRQAPIASEDPVTEVVEAPPAEPEAPCTPDGILLSDLEAIERGELPSGMPS